jgi:hypothetical protein
VIDAEILRGMYASGPQGPRTFANDGTPRVRAADEAPSGNQPQAGQPIAPDPVTGIVKVWAHDETAEPGKTYRYRIRVVLKNPVYKNLAAVKDPKLAEPAYLPENPEAGWSDWTAPVDIPTQVDMQFVGGASNRANFKVWKFEKGKTNQYGSMFTVEPGDIIGRVDKDSKVDYTTGWSVVDVRTIGNDTKVWIMNDAGRVEMRSMKADLVNQKFKKLENEAAGPKPDQQPVTTGG